MHGSKGTALPQSTPSLPISSTSTWFCHPNKHLCRTCNMPTLLGVPNQPPKHDEKDDQDKTPFEKSFYKNTNRKYAEMLPTTQTPFTERLRKLFSKGGTLRPLRLLCNDVRNIRKRYVSDWTLFNQLVFASAVYMFFTNILPGITFASDLNVLTGQTWGTIEVVFSTGLCGLVFAM
jgi:hypothetical protein